MNDVSACRENSSSQSELHIVYHELAPIDTKINASQVISTLTYSLLQRQIIILQISQKVTM
jgi:hypothetical protein